MTDVLLQQTDDEGDITVSAGVVQMTGGFETAVYLSMFGGDGAWWGNTTEDDPVRKYKGETEAALAGLPATPANLRKVEQAAARDLNWLVQTRTASEVTIDASMPGLNKINLTVSVRADGVESRFEFVENWKWQL